MYRHILLPVDGSEASRQAVQAGIRLAAAGGGRVTALHVIPTVRHDLLEAWAHEDPDYERRRHALLSRFADAWLSAAERAAAAAGVACTRDRQDGTAHRVIVARALQLECDLIFMASHGWSGGDLELLGSETLKVLLHSQVPVLVHKAHAGAGAA
ncbi:universal stress protein [Pseudoduganella sp. GCM10020061]|uniref:universal stress protein n=1 Tax=Pseudoduganella sp. GCM10020061 TaxID=3317345 RepID=UPI003626F7CC